jgi:predicted esterase
MLILYAVVCSLVAACAFVTGFLSTLERTYGWPYERMFLFGFSQGACVAFHVAMTLERRLGGVILVAGGCVRGPHMAPYQPPRSAAVVVETPAILLGGSCDDVYPLELIEASARLWTQRHGQAEMEQHVLKKPHVMVSSAHEMRLIMTFLSTRLYLRHIALEQRADVIEITP